MFIPLRDINPTHRFALITFSLLIINTGIFLLQIGALSDAQGITNQFALIPYELFHGNLPTSQSVHPYTTLITYMFLHGSIGHLAFNMLFLWIFGNNIEDVMTRPRFIMFYLLTGIISGFAFAFLYPGTKTFLVGASGAISAILGAYLMLFPRARITVLFVIFPIQVPAFIFLPFWFFMQIIGFSGGGGNVAWVSHIVGFISGIVLYKFYLRKRR